MDLEPNMLPVKTPFDRREFLKAGSIAALGLTLPAGLLKAAAAPAGLLPVLSVGFTPDAPTRPGSVVRLRAAKEMLAGDPVFLETGVSLRISTFARASRFQNTPGGVDVNVIFPSYGFKPEEYPEFQAWGFRHVDGVLASSSSLRFTVPVTATEGLRINLTRPQAARGRAARNSTPTAASKATASSLVLDPGVTSGSVKLRRGAYVIAIREDADEREPNWDSQALYLGDHGLAISSGANFTYLVATVDFPEVKTVAR